MKAVAINIIASRPTKRKAIFIMKRTKSMIYKETQESRKLFLYATNSDDLYRSMITGTINNLKKKAIKGQYDREKRLMLTII
nr:MAG: hypothetical protein [Bacteriophage sp.]